MSPWEIVEHLHSVDPSEIFGKLDPSDPFWVGASYAMDPFVGTICRIPISKDPPRYGPGLKVKFFEEIVDAVIAGKLTGDDLAKAVEAISKTCQAEEWLYWYKPILQGTMEIPVTPDQFNEYCPEKYSIRPVKLHKPKPISSLSDLPERFFMQPEYPTERVFWMIDSRQEPIEIRCYDSKMRRVKNQDVEDSFIEMAQRHPVNIVIFGHLGSRGFLIDDVLTREQFAQEGGAQLLHKRLIAAAALGVQPVQMSSLMTPKAMDKFYKELDLLLQQGFPAVVIRDLDGHYPFRVNQDVLVKPNIKATVTFMGCTPGVEIKAETMRGKKLIKANIRLGLTESVWKDISESSIGRRLDVLSCGQKGDELILPVFHQWR